VDITKARREPVLPTFLLVKKMWYLLEMFYYLKRNKIFLYISEIFSLFKPLFNIFYPTTSGNNIDNDRQNIRDIF